jgi:hypothetical protein
VNLLVKYTLDRSLRENVFEGAGFSGPGCQSLLKSPLEKGVLGGDAVDTLRGFLWGQESSANPSLSASPS